MFRALAPLLLCALVAPAAADPHARLVLVDPDPELKRALDAAIAERSIEVVVDDGAAPDDRAALARASKWHARYVVWRADDELIVFDADVAVSDRRATRMGPLGPAAADATAHTAVALLHVPERDLASRLQVRAEVGGGARVDSRETAPRFVGDLMIRPSRAIGLHVGLVDEFGAATKVTRGTFVGNASDLAAGAIASWSFDLGDHVAIEPFAIGGIVRASLVGFDGDVPQSSRTWLPTAAGGIWLRVRFNALMFALGGSARTVPTAPSAPMGLDVQVPRASFSIGLTAGVELGR